MRLNLYAHLSVLLKISAVIFIFFYLLFYTIIGYVWVLLISILLSEMFIRLFLQIRVVQINQHDYQ